jgi:glycosyltransferase involved in cell wall biosynthesis
LGNSRAAGYVALFLSGIQRIRLQTEALREERMRRRSRGRVIAVACWNFPIYSQTFVYQELTQLIRNGFQTRFVYSHADPHTSLPRQFSPLQCFSRRLFLHPMVCERAFDRYNRRFPTKVQQLIHAICRASGMQPEDLSRNSHFLQSFAFAELVEAFRPHYLHSYFFYEGTLFSFIASSLLDIPRGITCYADHQLQDYPLKLVSLHLEQCQLIIATSERIKQELLALAPAIHDNKILVKPNAVNTRKFPILPGVESDNRGTHRLVCVSRIDPKKGLIFLVEALGLLRDRHCNVELHIVGGGDNTPVSQEVEHTLKQRVQALGLHESVHFAGIRTESEIRRIFFSSHLFVAPSIETDDGDKDGIPTSLLEAMSSGLPVVATDAGSIGEVVTNGVEGLLVAQRDPVALADAIHHLLQSPAIRKQYGINGAKRVRDRFDISTCEPLFHDRLSHIIGPLSRKPRQSDGSGQNQNVRRQDENGS